MCDVSVCLPDPVSSSLAQSVMSMASSHSQHSHISTDTMSSMSGSYLAGAEGEPGGEEEEEEGGDDVEGEGEENHDAPMRESRGPSQQEGVRMEEEGAASSSSSSSSCGSTETCRLISSLFFHSGIFQGAKGTKLLSCRRRAGLRGEYSERKMFLSCVGLFL